MLSWLRLGRMGLKWGPLTLEAAKLLSEGARSLKDSKVGQLSDRVSTLERQLAEHIALTERLVRETQATLMRLLAVTLGALLVSVGALVVALVLLL